MESLITIKYDKGSMIINCDEFFPATTTRINKLLKIIELDFVGDEIIDNLLEILDGIIVRVKAEAQEVKEVFPAEYQRMCDLKAMKISGKYLSGVLMRDDERKAVEREYKSQNIKVKNLEKAYSRKNKLACRLKDNRDYIAEKTRREIVY